MMIAMKQRFLSRGKHHVESQGIAEAASHNGPLSRIAWKGVGNLHSVDELHEREMFVRKRKQFRNLNLGVLAIVFPGTLEIPLFLNDLDFVGQRLLDILKDLRYRHFVNVIEVTMMRKIVGQTIEDRQFFRQPA